MYSSSVCSSVYKVKEWETCFIFFIHNLICVMMGHMCFKLTKIKGKKEKHTRALARLSLEAVQVCVFTTVFVYIHLA